MKKAVWQSSTFIYHKSPEELEIKGTQLSVINTKYNKGRTNIVLNEGKNQSIFFKIQIKTRCSLSHQQYSMQWLSLNQSNRTKEENRNEKSTNPKEVMFQHLQYPSASARMLLILINTLSKVTGSKIHKHRQLSHVPKIHFPRKKNIPFITTSKSKKNK